MENMQSAADIVRKVAIVTLTGFLVIVLAGPVLAMVGVLLPFAIVGCIVWIVIHAVMRGPRAAGNTIRATGNGIFRMVVAVPVWIVSHVWGAVRFVLRSALALVGLFFRMLLPAMAGAVIFAILGVIGGLNHGDAEVRIPVAVAIGAAIGALAGALRSKPAPRVVIVHRTPAMGAAHRA